MIHSVNTDLFVILASAMALLAFACTSSAVQAPEPQRLWQDAVPAAAGDAELPAITVHQPPAGKATGTAIVICPGGGYSSLMMSYEGHDIARWLNGYGVTGIVLKYRVSPSRHPAPLLDGQRAIRLARANAAAWNIDPARIGMIGFSAGGHVASTVATHFDAGNPAAADPVDRVSSRPDFLLLIYPVITMGAAGHSGSRTNLLGPSPTPELLDLLSSEKQVTSQTPPTFLAHARTDKVVSIEHSRLFHAALKAHHVPSELLELPTGEHGLGCGKSPQWDAWQEACLQWLRARNLLTPTR